MQQIAKIVNSSKLISPKKLSVIVQDTISILEEESSSYRPHDSITGRPGGLLDFSTIDSSLPVIIVPDLHSRGDFFAAILKYKPVFKNTNINGSETVFDLLEQNRIYVICVGDGLHSELHKIRWIAAYNDYEQGNVMGEAISQEMKEGLALMEMVMKCKCTFPKHFHFLKGNHENILNSNRHGNHPFRKFVQEGEMVLAFMQNFYGEDLLRLYACMEDLFPLCAVFPNCVISHAEPIQYFSKDEIIDGLNDAQVTQGLTWTSNGDSQEGSVAKILADLLPTNSHSVYIAGHRPVHGNYSLRQGGKFIQIHNPREWNVAVVFPSIPFNPDLNIISVLPPESTTGGKNG